MYLSAVFLVTSFVLGAHGHGRLWLPPSRSSMWRQGFNNPENYNDHELFCGGFTNQWQEHDGMCGMCGDPFQGPRENEAGGLYANGLIGDAFVEGENIEITLDITANHMGWHEFRMCVWNNPGSPITQDCLDDNLLAQPDGTTRVFQPDGLGYFSWTFTLPEGVICSQCVIQWKWNTGNRWGVDEDTGEECVGCGPQEQFYGCSDIVINPRDGTLPPPDTTTPGPTTTPVTTTTVPTTTPVTTNGPTTTVPGPTTTLPPGEGFCDSRPDGFYPDPQDCTKFYQCASGVEYINQCPECTYYNPDIMACDFPFDDAVCYDDVCSLVP